MRLIILLFLKASCPSWWSEFTVYSPTFYYSFILLISSLLQFLIFYRTWMLTLWAAMIWDGLGQISREIPTAEESSCSNTFFCILYNWSGISCLVLEAE